MMPFLPIHAVALSPKGHPIKIQLPPRTTRVIQTETPRSSRSLCVIGTRALALHSVLLVSSAPEKPDDKFYQLLFYNGGYETQWIENGDIVAHIWEENSPIGPGRPGTLPESIPL